MSVQKKKLFNRGRKTGIKGLQKERRRNVKGGTSHSLNARYLGLIWAKGKVKSVRVNKEFGEKRILFELAEFYCTSLR